MNIKQVFEHLIAGNDLTGSEMEQLMQSCMRGELTDVQLGAFLALMRMKGETVDELTAAASTMLDFARLVDLGDDLIDIVGTGGDGKNTFNVSTVSSVVAAAAGAKVAKHGSRSVSSSSGSSDLLTQAGIRLELDEQQLQQCIKQHNLCFLFAPHFHPALQQAKTARQQLGVRSFFNLLGPLVNPARVKRQVIGVFDKRWQQPLLEVLVNLGSERCMVITSRDGLDEASIAAVSDVLEYDRGTIRQWTIEPERYDCDHENLDAVIVDSSAKSLELINAVLAGQSGAARDIVLLNTAAALVCADIAATMEEGVLCAADAIDSGRAKELFDRLKAFSQSL
ncbi:anthranilate phosphoribosyltransferase [Legionella dresdenensis]|uniref:Anthranilate phosphoribosyltransferase n=1 Tax=Legionella dresdenensis TaxID=450200 RepID=A0ABV8CBH2_9GAMM